MKRLNIIDKKYENFRWFFTSNNVLVVGGKSDEQNERALKEYLRPEYTVMHTSLPGSPFMIIISNEPTKSDLDECAVFCASFSKQWKLTNKEISIDIFKGEQIYKSKLMKKGTFGVKGDRKTVKVKPKLFLVMQKGKLRAVPKAKKNEILAEINQGNLTKEKAAEMISKRIKEEYHLPISKEEIMSAIPSDKIEIK